MKILQLKYKMHKLVNLAFYLIIFGIGFILGFGAEKININKLMSQFLFIDNVSAQTTVDEQKISYVCRDSVNLFDKNSALIGYELVSYDSGIKENNEWFVSDYIPVTPFVTYYLSGKSSGTNNMFYDSNKNMIGSIATVVGTITIPQGVSYLRFNGKLIDIDTTQLEVGYEPSSYESYGEEICFEKIEEDNSFYEFSKKILGEVSEENNFVYDFITFGLVATCFTLFVLIVGYIIRKFFGG